MIPKFRRVAFFKTPQQFQDYLEETNLHHLPFDPEVLSGPESPLAEPLKFGDFTIGNRFCALPMEGWDGTLEGRPSDLTVRRWQHFGESGAKLIWGGEAVAVRMDGRANPNQLVINRSTLPDLVDLRRTLVDSHYSQFGSTDDLLDIRYVDAIAGNSLTIHLNE